MGHAEDKQNVAFRVDASREIGTGHVMRCLSLAREMTQNGFAVKFVCRAHKGHMAEEIRGHGYELSLLSVELEPEATDDAEGESNYALWLGATWERDAKQTADSIPYGRLSWLIVDHYGINANWERKFRDITGAKVMVIDGRATQPHECDLLLDLTYSIAGASRWHDLIPESCQRIVGPQFMPLRPEFNRAIQTLQRKDGYIRRLFVAFGGLDNPNATELVLDVLANMDLPDVVFDVLIGAANQYCDRLLEKYLLKANFNLHVQPPNVAELMVDADLAISAGGSTLIEQCFLQLPSIVLSTAVNQIKPTLALHNSGVVLYIGHYDAEQPGVTENAIRDSVLQLLADPLRVREMRAKARNLMIRPDRSVSQVLLNRAHETP